MMMMMSRRRRRLYARHSFHFPSTPLSEDKSPGSSSTAFKVDFLYARTHTHKKKGVGSSPIGQKTTQNLSIRPLSLFYVSVVVVVVVVVLSTRPKGLYSNQEAF